MRKAQANAFQRAAQELGRENVAVEDWNRIFGGQTAAALDQKYATQQPATTAEPPKKKNRFGRFVDNLQSADFDDALGDIIHGGAVALAAPKEYLADPFMGIGSGATSRESKELLDANGNPTGRYYRDVHENSKHWGFIDVGSFARTAKSLKDFAKDPVGQYQEGRRAWDEAMASPEYNAFVRTAVQTATDPMLYVGQGTVGGLAKGLTARGLLPSNPAVRAALTGRYSPVGALLEGASAKSALGIALGAGAGAQAAESFDIPWAPEGLEQAVLPLAGGALGGGFGARAKLPTARPWKGAETATRADLGWDVLAMEGGAGPGALLPDPDDAEGRLRRFLNREATRKQGIAEGKEGPWAGDPKTPRVVFSDARGEIVFGTPTVEDWIRRVVTHVTPAEWRGARYWYEDGADVFNALPERDRAIIRAGAYMGQKNTSPAGGVLNATRAEDIGRYGLPMIKSPGPQPKGLIDLMAGRRPTEGFDVKLMDFMDSADGKTTRRVMGDDPAGGAPVVIDIWAARDSGLVDQRVVNYVGERFGDEAAAKLSRDFDSISETQYESRAQWYRELTDQLNAANFDGGGWKPHQVQAIGWVAIQKAMGEVPQSMEDAISANTRRVSFELAFGEGSPLGAKYDFYALSPDAQRAVTTEVVDKAVAWINTAIPQARVTGKVDSLGGWLDYDVAPSFQLEVFASPETAVDVADSIGYLLQQTEVLLSRPLASGKTAGMDIFFPQGMRHDDRELVTDFWRALRAKVPEYAQGFQPTVLNGRHGIRMLDLARAWRGEKGKSALVKALEEIEDELGWGRNSTEYRFPQFEISRHGHDWTATGDGNGYLYGPSSRGRSNLLRALHDISPERDRWVDEAFGRYKGGEEGQKGFYEGSGGAGAEGPAGLAFEAAPARALAPPGVGSRPSARTVASAAPSRARAPYTGPRPGVENAERLAGGAQPARGKKALINRILMEARRGREGSGLQGVGLDEDAARAAVEFIDALPEQYTELLASSFVSGRDISGRTASAGARVAGTYDPATALVTITKGITNSSADPERVIVHEIAHHLERFVTQEDHAALLRQYQREMGTPGILPGSGQGGEALLSAGAARGSR